MYGRRGGRHAEGEGSARAGHSDEQPAGNSEGAAAGPRRGRGRGQPELQARLTAAPVFVHGSPATQHAQRHAQPLDTGATAGAGRGRGRRGPKEEDEGQDDNRAVGAAPRRPSLAVGGRALDATCSVCVEPVRYFSVGACNHRTVCHLCALRLRALSGSTACVLCRSDQEAVVFTKDLLTPFQDMKLTGKPFDKRWGVYFESSELHSEVQQLFAYDCRVCSTGGPIRMAQPDYCASPHSYTRIESLAACTDTSKQDCKTLKGLKEHLKRMHELFLCDLCVAHLKVFIADQRLYTRRDLARHRRHGDRDDTSHKGHPLCEFCQLHFYGNDELLEHLRDRHFRCHLCHRAGQPNAYYGDYPELQRHFERDHILCPEPECLDKKFVVFNSDIDYRAHIAEEHARGLSRAQKKQALQIELGFQYDPPQDSDQPLGRGRARGRGRREPSPASSPQGPSRSASSQALDSMAPDLSDMGSGPVPLWVPGRTAPGGSMADAQFPALASSGAAPSPVGGLVAKKKKQKQPQAAPPQQQPAGVRPPPAGFGTSASGARAPPAGFGVTPTMRPVEPAAPSPPPPAPAPAPVPQPAAPTRAVAPSAFPPLLATAPRPSPAPAGRGAAPAASRRPTQEEMFPALAPVPQPVRPPGRPSGPNAARVAAGPPPGPAQSPRPLAADAFPALSAPSRPAPPPPAKAAPAAATPPASSSAADFPVLGNGSVGGRKALQDSGWVKPANYEERSAALAKRIRDALGSAERYGEFKRLAGEYRSGRIDAATYYGHYCSLLGAHAAGLFHEMVALLPDTDRQRALLGAHSDAKALQEQQRDEEEVRKVLVIRTKAKQNWATSASALPPRRTPHFLCPTCRQMIPHSDAQAHARTHKTAPAQQSAWS